MRTCMILNLKMMYSELLWNNDVLKNEDIILKIENPFLTVWYPSSADCTSRFILSISRIRRIENRFSEPVLF